jgi:hypothetical protein
MAVGAAPMTIIIIIWANENWAGTPGHKDVAVNCLAVGSVLDNVGRGDDAVWGEWRGGELLCEVEGDALQQS